MQRPLIPPTIKIGRHYIPPEQIKRFELVPDGIIRVYLHGEDHKGDPDYLDFHGQEAAALHLMLEESATDLVALVRAAAEGPYGKLFPFEPTSHAD